MLFFGLQRYSLKFTLIAKVSLGKLLAQLDYFFFYQIPTPEF